MPSTAHVSTPASFTLLPTFELDPTPLPSPRPGVPLSDGDVSAAEALVAAMRDWDGADLATYRDSVLAEVAALGVRTPTGFLAAELAALATLGIGPDQHP